MFKIRFKAACIAVFSIALAANPAFAQSKLEKFTIVASGGALHQMVQYVAQHAGYFAEEGLDLDSVVVNSGPRVVAAVQGGAEMGFLGCTEITTAASQGSNVALVGNGYDAYAVSLVLSKDAIAKTGITPAMPIDEKLKRLRGLRISITGPGSTTDLLIRSLYLARGMDPDKEVTLQPLGDGAAQLAAMQRKLTDGFIFGAPFPQIAVAQGIGQVVISPFDEAIPEQKGMIFLCFTSSKDTIAKKPAVIQAALRALTKSIKLLRENPQEAKRFLRMHYPDLDEAVFNAAFDTYVKGVPESPMITKEELEQTVAWRNIGAKTPMVVSFDSVVNNDFARKAFEAIMKK